MANGCNLLQSSYFRAIFPPPDWFAKGDSSVFCLAKDVGSAGQSSAEHLTYVGESIVCILVQSLSDVLNYLSHCPLLLFFSAHCVCPVTNTRLYDFCDPSEISVPSPAYPFHHSNGSLPLPAYPLHHSKKSDTHP